MPPRPSRGSQHNPGYVDCASQGRLWRVRANLQFVAAENQPSPDCAPDHLRVRSSTFGVGLTAGLNQFGHAGEDASDERPRSRQTGRRSSSRPLARLREYCPRRAPSCQGRTGQSGPGASAPLLRSEPHLHPGPAGRPRHRGGQPCGNGRHRLARLAVRRGRLPAGRAAKLSATRRRVGVGWGGRSVHQPKASEPACRSLAARRTSAVTAVRNCSGVSMESRSLQEALTWMGQSPRSALAAICGSGA